MGKLYLFVPCAFLFVFVVGLTQTWLFVDVNIYANNSKLDTEKLDTEELDTEKLDTEKLGSERCFSWNNNMVGVNKNGYWNRSTNSVNTFCNPKAGTMLFTIHKCCDSLPRKEGWRFVSSCAGSGRDMARTYANKTILFGGDSLTRQTVDSLVMHMEMDGIKVRKGTDDAYELFGKNNSFKKIGYCGYDWKTSSDKCVYKGGATKVSPGCRCSKVFNWHVKEYNMTIRLLFYYTMTLASYPEISNDKFISTIPSVLEHELKMADFGVINIGLHYADRKGYLYQKVAEQVLDILNLDGMRRNVRHVFRLTFPQHYSGGDYFLQRSSLPPSRHWTDLVASSLIPAREHVIGLDYYNVLINATALHRTTKDLTHFCWNPSMWSPFWNILTSIGNGHNAGVGLE